MHQDQLVFAQLKKHLPLTTFRRSDVLAGLERDGKIKIAGAMYHLSLIHI